MTYPGMLRIPLARLALGPNISYRIVNSSHPVPENWVYQLNATNIIINESIGDVAFFYAEKLAYEDGVIFYVQNSMLYTYIIECRNYGEETTLICRDQTHHPHTSQIVSFTTANFVDGFTNRPVHIYAMVL
jgi:hypothetical protein